MTDQVIYDRGYREYDGPRTGPSGARTAVYKEGLRRILVENGILNPDFTPNEATAAKLGWKLVDPPNATSLLKDIK